jgi:5-methylcytosine-specific restriction endonuclease McrA
MLPLSTISWQEAIRFMVLDKVSVMDWHEDWIVHSSNWSTRVPSVIMLKEYQKKKGYVRYSKMNVFLRDEFVCQYCATKVTRKTATLDHVLPISHGGKSTWENSTTACMPCNSGKGNNKHHVPKHKPHKPTYWELVEKRKKLDWDIQHPSWAQWLGTN